MTVSSMASGCEGADLVGFEAGDVLLLQYPRGEHGGDVEEQVRRETEELRHLRSTTRGAISMLPLGNRSLRRSAAPIGPKRTDRGPHDRLEVLGLDAGDAVPAAAPRTIGGER